MTTVPAEDMAQLLTALRDEFGGSVDALLTAAQRGAAVGTRRRRPDPVPVRTAGEVLDAVRLRLITQDEARPLLGLRARRAVTRKRAQPAPPRPSLERLVGDWRPPA